MSEATQAASATIDHEVHDKTVAVDEVAGTFAHVRLFDETSVTGKAGVGIEGEVIATTAGATTLGDLQKVHETPLDRASLLQTIHAHHQKQ